MESTAVRPSRGKNGNDKAAGPKDFYDVLGVKKDASKAEIADAFKRLALQYHPDRNKDREANRRFAEISRAYAVLSDDWMRVLYHALGPDRYDDPWWINRYCTQREEAASDAKAWERERWERKGGAVNTIIGSIVFLAIIDSLIPAYVLGPWYYVVDGFAILCFLVGVHQLIED